LLQVLWAVETLPGNRGRLAGRAIFFARILM